MKPMSKKDFDALPEYSCSIPTMTTIGKVWKCDLNFGLPTTEKDWEIREYIEIGDPDNVGIKRTPIAMKVIIGSPTISN